MICLKYTLRTDNMNNHLLIVSRKKIIRRKNFDRKEGYKLQKTKTYSVSLFLYLRLVHIE